MELDFYPVRTQDGSIGLFNTEVDDIYHSSYGAYNEAIQKFILPSGLDEIIKTKQQIKILDICYGMGYNSKCAIEKILQNNFDGEVFFDALEMDVNVAAFSLICENAQFGFNILEFVDFDILNNQKILDSIFGIIDNEKFDSFLDENLVDFFKINKKDLCKYPSGVKIAPCLHNIYYKYISARNIKKHKSLEKRPKMSLMMHLDDARQAIGLLEGNYDLIFLDAFTPTKLPTLWSVEFFEKLKSLLVDDGNLVTYSNSAAIRGGMVEAGFFVGKTEQGTIAYKDETLLKTPLDEKSLGLIQTKAGIPFYDENLNFSKEEILLFRQKLIDQSDRQSSSQFLKNFPNKKYRL